ncbi:MAG TPA: glycosyl hydrolase family 57 [Planctomycetota bacterium]
MAQPITDVIEGIPNLSGWEKEVRDTVGSARSPVFAGRTPMKLERINAAFAIALHMHQPLILNDGDPGTAPLVGNLQYMMDRQHIHGCHDAPVYLSCYSRIADFVREGVDGGRHPRVMLDYSGELLFGLRQMGRGDVLDNLKSVTLDDRYRTSVEWLGTCWGHAVIPSTPVPDIELHIRAWQHNFAAIFGWEALGRVRGFSLPEMHLPNHPDVSYSLVSALRAAGYTWVMVQEHTVEELDGRPLQEKYLPRRLTARNSRGETATITALIKTQGSDTKLVGHMQPLSEARSQSPRQRGGRRIPPLVAQISDGENGGVMMNEFPGHFNGVWHGLGTEGVVGLNGTEYLELVRAAGFAEADDEPIQPLHQAALWSRVKAGASVEKAMEEARKADHRFHMEGGSWTNDLSWVKGYDSVLDPIRKLSATFHETVGRRPVDTRSHAYRNALLHLLTAETSCYRYWGEGRFTEYARELCRRGQAILKSDF